MMPTELPSSYPSLEMNEISVSHVPPSSSIVTPVVLLTLNRPKHHNAFTEKMEQELVQAYTMFDMDPRVRAVVLTGAGRMFCAGADLDEGFSAQKKSARDAEHRDGGGRVALAMHNCSKPTLVAINGSSVGVGITMTLPASIRVACATAKIGFVFSRRGIVMEACSSYFLPRLVGLSKAMHLTTTGSVYPATHPLFADLFSEIHATPEATVARALEIAKDIARNTSTISTKVMRDMMYRGPTTAEGAHLLESRMLAGLLGGKENVEGVQSFLEKRTPEFQGQVPDDAPHSYPFWETVDVSLKEKPSNFKAKL